MSAVAGATITVHFEDELDQKEISLKEEEKFYRDSWFREKATTPLPWPSLRDSELPKDPETLEDPVMMQQMVEHCQRTTHNYLSGLERREMVESTKRRVMREVCWHYIESYDIGLMLDLRE